MSNDLREAALKALSDDEDLTVGARLLLLAIGDLVDGRCILKAGTVTLAGRLGVSRSQVQRWREELVNSGYLAPEVLRRKGGQVASSYRVTLIATAQQRAVDRSGAGGSTAQELPTNCPGTAHEPPTSGHKQEQEQEQEQQQRADESEALKAAALRIAKARGARNPRGYAQAILRADAPEQILEEASRVDDPPEDRRQALAAWAALVDCGLCSAEGWRPHPDNPEVLERCGHPQGAGVAAIDVGAVPEGNNLGEAAL